jgi:TRL-like protein family
MGMFARAVAALALVMIGAGCTAGILYTHTVQPLTINHRETPIAGTEGQNEIKHIQIPYVGIMWGDAALGDIAREKGLRDLYYADLEVLSVLTIWRQHTVHLYGK